MCLSLRRAIAIGLIATFLVALVVPEARADPLDDVGRFFKRVGNDVKHGVRRVGHAIKEGVRGLGRGARFVGELPGKVRHRLSEVMPPAAAVLLTEWLVHRGMANPRIARLLRRGRRAADAARTLEQVDAHVRLVRDYYGEEARKLRENARLLRETQSGMSRRLVSGRLDGTEDVRVRDFLDTYVALDFVAEAQERLAERLEDRSRRFDRDDLVQIIGREALGRTLQQSLRIVADEVSEEMLRGVDPEVLIRTVRGGLAPGAVIEAFVVADVSREMGGARRGDPDFDAMVRRITARVRDKLRENRELYKSNWRELVTEAVVEETTEREKVAGYEPEEERTDADAESEEPEPPRDPVTGETDYDPLEPGEGGQQATATDKAGGGIDESEFAGDDTGQRIDESEFAADEAVERVAPEAGPAAGREAVSALLGRTYEARPQSPNFPGQRASGSVSIEVAQDRRVTVTFMIRVDSDDGYRQWAGTAHGTAELLEDGIGFTCTGPGTFRSRTLNSVTGEPTETTQDVEYEPYGMIYPDGTGSGHLGFSWGWILEDTGS